MMKKLSVQEKKEVGQEIKSIKKDIKFLESKVPKNHPMYKELLDLWERTLKVEKRYRELKAA